MSNSVCLVWIGALASASAFACSAADVGDPASEASASTLAQDLRRSAPRYVTLRRDVRRCAAPLCGGFFVDSVNQDTLRCVDGEVWQAQAGATPSGRFFRARNEGIVCITSPCLSFSAELLNRRAESAPIAEIDLSRVTPDPTAAFEQLNAADGLLLAGWRISVTGPTGRARGLRASEFYLPLVAEVQSCGSRGQAQCAEGSFCNFPVEAACGSFDAPGVCEPSPAFCIEIFAPVCGCDGQTYDNSCFAAGAGVSVEHDSACDGSSE